MESYPFWVLGVSYAELFSYIYILLIIIIVSNNINSYTYNQSADQLLNTFKTMEKKQIAYVSVFNYKLNIL